MWIEFGNRLINLDHIISIWQTKNWVSMEVCGFFKYTKPVKMEKYDTEEEAKARYEEIKAMLLSKPNVDDLLTESEVVFMKHRTEVSE